MGKNTYYAELSSALLRGYDAEIRFRKRVAEGDSKKGLAILDKIDKHFMENRR